MIVTLLVSMLISLSDGGNSITKIARENSVKKEAEEAYQNKNYAKAIEKFTYLTDTLKVADEKAILNLGHAYYKTGDLPNAAKSYEKLYGSANNNIKSIAAQQLGIISYKGDKDKEKALAYFKDALRANPANAEARYNYELLKKMQDKKDDPKMDNKQDQKKDQDKQDQNKQDQNQQNKDQQNKDQQGKDNKNGDKGKDQQDQAKNGDKKDGKNGEKDKKEGGKDGKEGEKGDKGKDQQDQAKNGDKKDGDKGKDEKEGAKADNKGKDGKEGEKGESKNDKKDGKESADGQALKEKDGGKKGKDKMVTNPEALAKMGMTEQKAKALLNAMKSSETQYVQQMKRETNTNKKQKKGKPDW